MEPFSHPTTASELSSQGNERAVPERESSSAPISHITCVCVPPSGVSPLTLPARRLRGTLSAVSR